jgi:hypothetical protein
MDRAQLGAYRAPGARRRGRPEHAQRLLPLEDERPSVLRVLLPSERRVRP